MSQKNRVALIDPIGNHGGMNFYDDGLCLGLQAQNVQVFLFSNYISTFSEKSFPYFTSQWATKNKLLKVFRFYIGIFKSLRKAKEHKVQSVHLHSFKANPRLLTVVWLAKKIIGRVILTNHDVSAFAGKDNKWVEERIHHLSDKIIVHNQFSKDELLKKLPEIKNKTSVIPHGNYLPFIENNEVVDFEKKKTFTLLFFGQIKEVKGLDVLLNAFAEFSKDKEEVNLIIAGKVWKDSFEKYQSIIDENNLEEKVELNIRYIAEEEIPKLYQRADFIVLPYRRIYQSGVLLHSMSFGCPVIVSDLPPLKEMVENGINGYVFKSEDTAALKAKLEEAYQNQQEIKLMRKACLTKMKNEFDWKQIGEKIKKLYEKN